MPLPISGQRTQSKTSIDLTKESLQQNQYVGADNGRLVGEEINLSRFKGRQFDIENHKNGTEQYRVFQLLQFDRLGLFFSIGFEILSVAIAAVFAVLALLRAALFAIVLARRIRHGRTAASTKQVKFLQFILADVLTQSEARRAQKHGQCEDDM